jgi:beta-N-acetylhexosaminidase
MELKKIIGQLFIIGFQGDALVKDSSIAEDIAVRNLGGIILFDRFLAGKKESNNVISKPQVKLLTKQLQHLAGNNLLISVDQEGGRVCRLKKEHGFPTSPTAHEIDGKNDITFSISQAELIASTLSDSGINFNFAPVADLDLNKENPVIGGLQRSFSADPDRVIEQCEVWLDCHKKHGVLSCLKHFPGHGSSQSDSHHGFVDITENWQDIELVPYKELIAREKVDAIMMGHLFHNRMDPQYPASLSNKIIGQLLRTELGFNGVVITDDMQMKAITDRYGLRESIVLALSAGVDLIIFGNNLHYDANILQKAIAYVEDAVDKKEITIETIMAAHERVQQLKRSILQ